MKILTVVGARPQFVKAAMVSRAIRRTGGLSEKILHTGQHYDFRMSEIFFREMGIAKPYRHLDGKSPPYKGITTQGMQTGKILAGIEKELMSFRPDIVLVYGDTNSTLAGALAASKLHISVAHIEAGLRSFNREMPEEINRIISDRISDLLFVPTTTAAKNLKAEGITKNIHRVGDVMIDAIYFFRERARRLSARTVRRLIPNEPYFALTLHRQENTDNPNRLRAILNALAQSPHPFVFPIHPRTRGVLKKQHISLPSNVIALEPLPYLEMMLIQDRAMAVWTDSGGIQKEAVVLGKPCFTLRDQTEWVETVKSGWNMVLGADPDAIRRALSKRLWEKKRKPFPTAKHYGDGHASDRIARILSKR